MKRYAYDIECFKNLFTATFVNVEDESDVLTFSIGLGHDDLKKIISFLENDMILIGYNNHSYDDAMLRGLKSLNSENAIKELYELSGDLIYDSEDNRVLSLRYPKQEIYPWVSIDLMKILAFDKLGISLKQTAINLRWHKIQDLPFQPESRIEEKDYDLIMSYNMNDVLITKRLYEEIEPLRKLRSDLSKLYRVNLTSASDSKIANILLEHIYADELHVNIRSIRDKRTERDKVLLGDCIAKFISFKTPELQELLDRIKVTYVYQYNYYRYNEKVYFANCTFALGIGGLHSEDAPGKFESDDRYIIQDMDVASYYPNLIINNNFYPQHLGPSFIQVLKRITQERMAAKKAGDKVKADGLKITINSIFGKLGSPTFWLLDAKQFLSTTLSGQLGLLMLIEDLYLNGIEILSCNTDGVVCRIPRELESTYYEITKRWEQASKLELEFTPYKKYVRRDVNSYVTQKIDGSIKTKGAFLKEVDLKKAYHMPIVAKALHAYFIEGIPVRKTLEDCKDIMEFCISQKSASNFQIELHTSKGIEKLQKTNRFYISKKGGSFIKRDITTKRMTGLYVGYLVQVLNNYNPDKPFDEYDIDLAFYEKEVMKIIDEIEPPQLSLFDISTLGKSSLIKMDFAGSKLSGAQETFTANDFNKLGRNQFPDRVKSIVKNGQVINGISPRYVCVTKFDPSTKKADIYCLAKGVTDTLTIDKKALKKNELWQGAVIFCDKFDGHTLVEYHHTERFEDKKEKLI